MKKIAKEESTVPKMKYYVLNPVDKFPNDPYAKASRIALRAYAEAIKNEDVTLCKELKDWALGGKVKDFKPVIKNCPFCNALLKLKKDKKSAETKKAAKGLKYPHELTLSGI